jgi:hypothetical protein
MRKEEMPNATRHQGKRFFVSRRFGGKGSFIILGIARCPFFLNTENYSNTNAMFSHSTI